MDCWLDKKHLVKEISKMISSKDQAVLNGIMALFGKENLQNLSWMVKEKYITQMAILLRLNGKKMRLYSKVILTEMTKWEEVFIS